jgi:hypothetical protein
MMEMPTILPDSTDLVEISAIIAVLDRVDDTEAVWAAYRAMLESTGKSFEAIYILDGDHPSVLAALERLQAKGEPITIVKLNRSFGEAACLREGAKRATGEILLMIPAYLQVVPNSIPQLIDALETADFAVASRDRRDDLAVNRLRGRIFQRLAAFGGSRFDDPGCDVRAVRRRVFDEITVHDEQHRFLPMLAERQGFKVRQISLPQAPSDRHFRAHRPGTYASMVLDIVAMSFLMRFLQKPFRFFGTIGAAFVLLGFLAGLYILVDRLVFDVAMADRPMLLLTVLMIVLGIQIGAVGLIAEIIIFTRSGRTPTFHIERIVERPNGQTSVAS